MLIEIEKTSEGTNAQRINEVLQKSNAFNLRVADIVGEGSGVSMRNVLRMIRKPIWSTVCAIIGNSCRNYNILAIDHQSGVCQLTLGQDTTSGGGTDQEKISTNTDRWLAFNGDTILFDSSDHSNDLQDDTYGPQGSI